MASNNVPLKGYMDGIDWYRYISVAGYYRYNQGAL